MRYRHGMPATIAPEAERLADELVKRLGNGRLTAREVAAELVSADSPVALIGAFDDALMRAAAAGETDELDDTLWGPAPGDQQLADARQIARSAADEAMAAALAGALTRGQAAQRLGISAQAVSKRHAAGRLVALSRGRVKLFPAWQFHEDGVLPGVADVLAAYPGGPLSLSTWATTPNPDLDEATPAQTLVGRGGVSRVLEALRPLDPDAW